MFFFIKFFFPPCCKIGARPAPGAACAVRAPALGRRRAPTGSPARRRSRPRDNSWRRRRGGLCTYSQDHDASCSPTRAWSKVGSPGFCATPRTLKSARLRRHCLSEHFLSVLSTTAGVATGCAETEAGHRRVGSNIEARAREHRGWGGGRGRGGGGIQS